MADLKKDVERFLVELREKIRFFGILFRDDRGKNMRALLELEITPKDREEIIKNLKVEDYMAGPIEDTLHKINEMWEFGRKVKGKDVYIKVSKGYAGSGALCISFHLAERPLVYKFKNN